MAVVEGAYDPLPAPPLAISGTAGVAGPTGTVISFDGQAVTADGSYLYDNNLVTMAGYQNTFPNFIVGWPDTVYSNYEGQGDYGDSPYLPHAVTHHNANHADQNSISGVPESFVAE